jgi:hypothetical protein
VREERGIALDAAFDVRGECGFEGVSSVGVARSQVGGQEGVGEP